MLNMLKVQCTSFSMDYQRYVDPSTNRIEVSENFNVFVSCRGEPVALV